MDTSTNRTIICTCSANLLISLDATIINVALPTIQHKLDVPTGALSWAVEAYSILFATLMLSGGALSDRIGPARAFMCGIVTFGLGSLVCAIAPGFLPLLFGRVVQGVGAAICMPSALAVLRSTVPPQQLGRAIALWVFSASVAVSAASVIGGVLVQFLEWRSIFIINIPIVALVVFFTLPNVRGGRQAPPAPSRSIDIAGQALYIGSSGLLIGGLILLRDRVESAQWRVPIILLTLAVGGLATFYLTERRAANPALPPFVMKNRVFQSAAIIGSSVSIVNFGLVYCLGLYYGSDHGFTALKSGLLFLPMMLACGVSTTVVERVRRAIGDRITVVVGLALQLFGTVLIGVQPESVGWVSASATLLGLGVGFAIPTITASLLAAVDAKISGVVSGAFSSIRQFGSALGVAVLGLMVHGTHTSVRVDLRSISAVCAAVMATALVICLASTVLKTRTTVLYDYSAN